MTPRRLPGTALLAALVLLAACSGSDSTAEDDATPAATSEPTVTSPASEPTSEAESTVEAAGEPTTPPPSTESTGDPSPDGTALPDPSLDEVASSEFPDTSGEIAYLEEVEIGVHADYERVVFTFTDESSVPAWRVAYADEITQPGSGNPVDVAGEAFLHVVLSGGTGVDMTGETFEEVYTGPDQLQGEDAGAAVVNEVVLAGDFEAVMEWGIGLDEQRPFRAFALSDPARVVVDITTG